MSTPHPGARPAPFGLRGRRRIGFAAGLVAASLLIAACSKSENAPGVTDVAAADSPAASSPRPSSANETAASGPGATGAEGAGTTAADSGTDATPSDTAAPVPGGNLTLALGTNPICINPRGGGSGNDQLSVARQLVDSLVYNDPDSDDLLPWLAESWDISDDSKSFTFHLRDDVTFSDGTPLTAEVVKLNFDNIVELGAKATWAAAAFTGYQSSTVVDEKTVTVAFDTPNASFLEATSGAPLGILAASTVALPFEQWCDTNLIGTGPFTLDHYTQNTEIVINKRDGYNWGPELYGHQGDAYLDSVTFQVVPEASVRVGSLQSGQVDSIGAVPPAEVENLKGSGYELVIRTNPGITFGLTPNNAKPFFADDAVRKAISAAINRTEVRDAVLSTDFGVATSVLSQTTFGYTDLSADLTFDPAAAAALLDAAGWVPGDDGIRVKDGVRLHLITGWLTNFGPNQLALELIQQQLGDVGIELELKGLDGPAFNEALNNGEFDITWSNLSRADGDILRTGFSSAGANRYNISDPELEAALQAQQATSDSAERAAQLKIAQQIIVEKGYQTPVFELVTILGISDRVHGLSLAADSRLAQLYDTWVSA